MTHSESELERMVAAARGIPAPPPPVQGAELSQRLTTLTVWLRFWHERRERPPAVLPDTHLPAVNALRE